MITLNWLEIKPSKAGGKFAVATANDGTKDYENVTIFSSFPNFDSLRAGSSVDGTIVPNDYNGKKGWKLVEAKTNTLGKPSYGGFKKDPTAIDKMMDKKDASIEKFQTNKENNIEKLAVFRDSSLATNLWFTRIEHYTTEEYFAKWEEFRKGFEAKMSNPF